MHVEPVTVEHHREPLGIGEAAPRLSWVTRTERPGWTQQGYEIEISAGDTAMTTGRVDSAESVLVPWPAAPLTGRDRRSIRVRVWGGDVAGGDSGDEGEPSPWSGPSPI